MRLHIHTTKRTRQVFLKVAAVCCVLPSVLAFGENQFVDYFTPIEAPSDLAFYSYSLNNQGQIAVLTSHPNHAILSGDPAQLDVVAEYNPTTLPFTSGRTLKTIHLDDSGIIRTHKDSRVLSLFTQSGDHFSETILRSPDFALFGVPRYVFISNTGQAIGYGDGDYSNRVASRVNADQSFTNIIPIGQQAPGLAPGLITKTNYSKYNSNYSTYPAISINDHGTIATIGAANNELPDSDPQFESVVAIWLIDNQGVATPAYKHTDAPTPINAPPAPFGYFTTLASNNQNHLVFTTFNYTPHIVGRIYTNRTGSLEVLAETYANPPGLPDNLYFGQLTQRNAYIGIPPIINANDRIAFQASLTNIKFFPFSTLEDHEDSGVWTDHSGQLDLLYREGDIEPVSGLRIGEPETIYMNAQDQIAIRAKTISQEGLENYQESGLWIFGPRGEVHAVATPGQMIDGKTVEHVGVIDYRKSSGGEDGWNRRFNDMGQLIYHVKHTPGIYDLYVYTPDLHLRDDATQWDDRYNWTLSTPPTHVHDVFVDPTTDTTLTGPASPTTLANLTLGLDPQTAPLDTLLIEIVTNPSTTLQLLPDAPIDILGDLTIHPGVTLDLTSFTDLIDDQTLFTFMNIFGDFDQIITPTIGGQPTYFYQQDNTLLLSTSAASAIPEPTTLSLLLFGVIASIRRRNQDYFIGPE